MEQLRFTLPEIFSFIGVIQCVFILVYMLFRAGKLSRASIPFLYFLILGMAFFLDFSDRFISDISPYFDMLPLIFWFAGPQVAVLVVIQIAQINKIPDLRHFWVLLLPLLSFVFAYKYGGLHSECINMSKCQEFRNWLVLGGLISGGISLLSIWTQKDMLSNLLEEKNNKERYWLILTIIISNIFFLALMFGYFQDGLNKNDIVLVRTLFGLAFVYLVMTSLFRIYPQAVDYSNKAIDQGLSNEEKILAEKIESLLKYEKIYHETSYSRSDLAKELGISEMQTSKIINQHFKKSFPQLLNEHRIEDAKNWLINTDENISVIYQEVGFNSLPSFNRVFKDMLGETPSQFRKNHKT